MPSNHLILCHPLLLLPSIFPNIRVFSNVSVLLIRWPKYWSFSFGISPSYEYSGLISFRIHLLDLLAVQGTFKSPLQHHSSKASILRCSAFFTVCGSSFYPRNFYCSTEGFNFSEAQTIDFSFINCAFGVLLRWAGVSANIWLLKKQVWNDLPRVSQCRLHLHFLIQNVLHLPHRRRQEWCVSTCAWVWACRQGYIWINV